MLCGTVGTYADHLKHVSDVVGRREGVSAPRGHAPPDAAAAHVFVCDTYINVDPSAEELTEFTLMAAEEVRRFGLPPRGATVSFELGTSDAPSARKMRDVALLQERAPDLEIDGEMHADAALSRTVLNQTIPDARLSGAANLLIMPNLDAANITFNALKVVSGEGDRRSHPAWHRSAGAHPDANQHRAPHPQHDRTDGRRRRRSAVKPS